MKRGMIWNTYFRHRKKDLCEMFPQCGRRGTFFAYMTVLRFRAVMGRGINYYYVYNKKCQQYGSWDSVEKIEPMSDSEIPDNYYVKTIRLEFLGDSVDRYMINCYCCKWKYADPVIEIPALNLKMNIRYWWPNEVRDFIEHVHVFFPRWREETRLIEHEIPKIEKMREMNKIRSERLGMRNFESFIESRYQGMCEIEEGKLYVVVPLCSGRTISFRMPIRHHIPDWWERCQEIVSAIVEHFQTEIVEGRFEWRWVPLQIACETGGCSRRNMNNYSWREFDELDGLFKKRSWRKCLPITVEIT